MKNYNGLWIARDGTVSPKPMSLRYAPPGLYEVVGGGSLSGNIVMVIGTGGHKAFVDFTAGNAWGESDDHKPLRSTQVIPWDGTVTLKNHPDKQDDEEEDEEDD